MKLEEPIRDYSSEQRKYIINIGLIVEMFSNILDIGQTMKINRFNHEERIRKKNNRIMVTGMIQKYILGEISLDSAPASLKPFGTRLSPDLNKDDYIRYILRDNADISAWKGGVDWITRKIRIRDTKHITDIWAFAWWIFQQLPKYIDLGAGNEDKDYILYSKDYKLYAEECQKINMKKEDNKLLSPLIALNSFYSGLNFLYEVLPPKYSRFTKIIAISKSILFLNMIIQYTKME